MISGTEAPPPGASCGLTGAWMIATASDFIDWGSTLFDVANTLIYVDAVHYFRDGVLLLIKASYIDHPRLRGAHRGVAESDRPRLSSLVLDAFSRQE